MQPAVEAFVRVLESYRGRDKVIRTVCYGSQLLGGALSRSTETSVPFQRLGKSLLLFSAELSHCRTVLRLFDDLSMLAYSRSYGFGHREEDGAVRWISVLNNIADQLYYPCEHIAWAADAKLIQVKSDLWGTSLLLGMLRMDSDHISADEPSDPRASADGTSEPVELSRKVITGSELEDLDSYDLIEPPPLDWKSDSSSESVTAEDLDDPAVTPAVDYLDKVISGVPVLDLDDTVAGVERNQRENITESIPVPEGVEEDGSVKDECEQKAADLENSRQYQEEASLRDLANIVPEEESANLRSGDEDHTHIQTLLSQLHLMEEEPDPSHRAPPSFDQHQYAGLSALESSSLTTNESSENTGLLFSESHHRDLLGLLQSTEITSPSHPTFLPDTGEVDAVVSVSYNQEDAQRFWGHSGNGRQQRHRDDSLTSLPRRRVSRAGVDEAGGGASRRRSCRSERAVPGPCDPEDLLDGVIFGAKYLGSTQIKSEKNPSTNARMAQAQEAVDRIKAPEGESQPMSEVDLFISTQRIKVLSADTQEAMMDHALQMISYIADIGNIVVLMARRKRKGRDGSPNSSSSSSSSSGPQKKCLMICHVFSSEDAQIIAQAIGQAFGVAYQQFLQANGIKASDLRPGEYSDYLESQELYNGDLAHFSDSQNLRDVVITKAAGEILGLAVVESGWGSILPTVMVANLLHGGPAERCGELSIGDRIMSVNATSLVGPAHHHDLKSQKYVKLSIVHCPPGHHGNHQETGSQVSADGIVSPIVSVSTPLKLCQVFICLFVPFSAADLQSDAGCGIAERGGIRVGHRIIEINGQSVVATSHDKIIHILTNAVGEIHLKTMPASTYRLLTGQEQPVFL
ncbi:unnamed protein product [Lampetra planeri]